MQGRFDRDVEPQDLTLTIDMFGEEGLPAGTEVESVSSTSDAWQVEARSADEGVYPEVRGDGGPQRGEIRLTVDFDASDVDRDTANPNASSIGLRMRPAIPPGPLLPPSGECPCTSSWKRPIANASPRPPTARTGRCTTRA